MGVVPIVPIPESKYREPRKGFPPHASRTSNGGGNFNLRQGNGGFKIQGHGEFK